LEIGKNHKGRGLVSREVGGWLSFSLKSKTAAQGAMCVGGCVVMVQVPGIVVPLDWTFAPDVFPQLPQNIAIEVSIHGLSWWNKFLMHIAFSVKITNQHWFDIASNLCFLGSLWIWCLPLRWLLLRLRVVSVNPKFITRWSWGRFRSLH
jgi:hypothetical protein